MAGPLGGEIHILEAAPSERAELAKNVRKF
jgi:hypothetical protein